MKFLKYVGAELEESNEDYSDEFVKQLQKSVEKIKLDREMGVHEVRWTSALHRPE